MPHHALKNEDILREIFMHLSPAAPRKILIFVKFDALHRATLLNAALSCRSFHNPALDVLWRTMDDITNLFRILPAFYKLDEIYVKDVTRLLFIQLTLLPPQVLDGPISEEDWSRFDMYARRIRQLIFVDIEADPTVYTRMTWLKKSAPLLPCLTSLSAAPLGPGMLSLLSPTLRTVRISAPSIQNYPVVWVALEVLTDAERFPYLEELFVQSSLTAPSLLSFPRITNLRDLTILEGVNDLGIFTTLSALRRLTSLRIEFEEPSSFVTQPDASSIAFPSLETLSLAVEIRYVIPLLQVLPSNVLQNLGITAGLGVANNSREKLNWSRIFETITSKFSNSLKSLRVMPDDVVMHQTPSNDFRIFEPLLDIHGLEVAEFRWFAWMLFSDEEYGKIASAWLKARKLEFPSSDMPKATLASLQCFGLTCRYLRHLAISFDARNLPPIDTVTLPSLSHALETLDVQRSPIKSERAAARHIDRLFPSVTDVLSGSLSSNMMWHDVGDLLSVLKAVRADERARDGVTSRP
ncbi:hypothetical protein Hypma_002864 [Hypsizygus marmoreus]|uniref:F-box domain-containing protein n=1 Tax=Hypsizygus marmoreus TaxID=39966 RepID=A0A369J7N9_HYPMA|nr:hypothetical protein Hypma_002864 [Hypsizygus marmoreus]